LNASLTSTFRAREAPTELTGQNVLPNAAQEFLPRRILLIKPGNAVPKYFRCRRRDAVIPQRNQR
jgi:hypothetical protein